MTANWTFQRRLLRSALRVILFLLVGICLMGPLAPDAMFPVSPDHANHTAGIVQARSAITEGQFPLRIAPGEFGGLRYPHFQFYSWFPYWIGGLLYKYVHPDNPWIALKWVYILAICFAGNCMHSALRRLDLSEGASLAGSVVYVTAPYLLVNLYSRGAFTEAIAQAELPLAFWGLVHILKGSVRQAAIGFAAASVSVYFLASTHIITFAYGLLFLLIFTGFLTAVRALSFIRAAVVVAALAAGCLLAAHQLVPILATSDLAIRGTLLSSPVGLQHLSPLSIVMSLGPAAPYLAAGQDLPGFWPQVGFPILLAACLAVFLLVNGECRQSLPTLTLFSSLSCLVLAILTASATFDIWRYLPSEFYVLQFPYRLLTFAGFFGALVAGIAAHIAEERFKLMPIGMAALALLSAALWQPRMGRSGRTVSQVMAAPDLGYGSGAYLMSKAATLPSQAQTLVNGPVIFGDGWLNLGAKLRFSSAQLREKGGVLRLSGHQVAQSKGCQELHVIIGPNKIVVPSQMTSFTAAVPASDLLQAAGNASDFEVGFDSPCAFVASPQDPRRLFMYATELEFVQSGTGILIEEAKKLCRPHSDTLRCEVQSTAPQKIQLPIFYYPQLLSVQVNGIEAKITPVEKGAFILAMVELPAGSSTIIAKFTGSPLGNYLSLGSFLCLIIGIPLFSKRLEDGTRRSDSRN